MSERDITVLQDGQLAVATVEQTGTLITGASAIDTTCLVQTEHGVQNCVKTYRLNGGGGGGGAVDDVKVAGTSVVTGGVANIAKATTSKFGVVKPDGTSIAANDGTIGVVPGGVNYANLANLPQINGTTLTGNKTGADLGLTLVIEAANNTTVNGYQVPSLTTSQIMQAYNGIVAGKQVVITDSTGNMHFTVNQADSVSGDVMISFEYFDIMELTYLEDGTIEYRSHNNQITLTEAEYEALTEYADHTDYRIIEEA